MNPQQYYKYFVAQVEALQQIELTFQCIFFLGCLSVLIFVVQTNRLIKAWKDDSN